MKVPTNIWDLAIEQSKGQLISELLFDVLHFQKQKRQNLMNFCLRIYKVVESQRYIKALYYVE